MNMPEALLEYLKGLVSQGDHSVDSILRLIICYFSAIDPSDDTDYSELLDDLQSFLLDKTDKLKLQNVPEDDFDRGDFLANWLSETVMRRLKIVQSQRLGSKNFASLLGNETTSAILGTTQATSSYTSVFRQVIRMLNANSPIEDLKQSGTILKSISSSFNFFFQSAPKGILAEDTEDVVVFVIGGLRAAEVADMKREWLKDKPHLIIGTTTFCDHPDIVDTIFSN